MKRNKSANKAIVSTSNDVFSPNRDTLKPIHIDLGGSNYIELSNNSLSSNLYDSEEPINTEYNAAVNAFESLILAMYCEGIDLTTPEMNAAMLTTMDRIVNTFID